MVLWDAVAGWAALRDARPGRLSPGGRKSEEEAMAEEKKQIMTTDAGRPVGDNQNSLTVGTRGPVVF